MAQTFRILCPVDFSECSLNAVEYAARLGEIYQAELVLFHVLNRSDYLNLSPNDIEGKYQVEFVHEKLNNLKDAVIEESLPKGLASCEIHLEKGDMVEAVGNFASHAGIHLIVVGTEGVRSSSTKGMGSRASRLVSESEKDVLVIPRSGFFKPLKRIAYAQDYLEEDKLAIQKVITVARAFKSHLDIVHFTKKVDERAKSLQMTMQEELEPFCKYEDCSFSLREQKGSLHESIDAYIEESKIQMLFTLNEPQSLFDKIFDRSLSKKLAYSLDQPLWVIKSF
ncbi:universal stress protein [Algoriphagus namhaensis]